MGFLLYGQKTGPETYLITAAISLMPGLNLPL